MVKKNKYSGIPDDIIELLKNDWRDEDEVLVAYHEMMGMECEGYDRDARIQFIRDSVERFSWNRMHDVLNEFKERARELARMREVDKKREVLLDIERMIGGSCYNGNIQNYSSWGVWDSSGRSFRYPLTYHDDNGRHKCWSVASDVPAKSLMDSYYAFGANHLHVMQAAFNIIRYLEENYGLDLNKKKG